MHSHAASPSHRSIGAPHPQAAEDKAAHRAGAQSGRTAPAASPATEAADPPDRAAYLVTGVHFGILQASLFFAAQVYISATIAGYFVVVLAWMAGTIVSMHTGRPRTLPTALALSAAAYLGFIALGSVAAPGPALYPFFFGFALIGALPAGTFFREGARRSSAHALFLHENNGFVLGLLMGMLGFVHWGVGFLFVGPFISMVITLSVYRHAWIVLAIVLPGAAYASARLGSTWAAWTLAIAAILGVVSWHAPRYLRRVPLQWRPRADEPSEETKTPTERIPLPRLMLGLAGANLILLQYFLTREFSTVLAASELAILVVAIAYFAGFSVGYAFSKALTFNVLRWVAAAMFLIHLAILVFAKVLAGVLIDAGYGLSTMFALLFVTSFVGSSFYSILLPRAIDSLRIPLVSAYGWDLVGAVIGTTFMLFLVPLAPVLLWPAYFAALLTILLLLHWRLRRFVPVAVFGGAGVLAIAALQGPIHRLATEDYYRTRGYDHPSLVFSGNSFHHSIDVLDTFDSPEQTTATSRVSFINGVRYFRQLSDTADNPDREASLSEFTYFLAELPARLLYEESRKPLRILIMGGGSLSTISRVAPYSKKTTLVEIDPVVVRSSKEAWSHVNRWDEVTNAEIVIDDARHYLRTTDERFDLIINDVSAPYYLGTAIMHSTDVYRLVRDRLAPGGIFSESTQSRPDPRRPGSQAMKILRGVADVFPVWRAVDCRYSPRGRRGYVYATVNGKLTTEAATEIMKSDDKYVGTATYWEGTDHFRLHYSEAFSLHDLSSILRSNVGRIKRRLGINGRSGASEQPSLIGAFGRALDSSDQEHSRLLVAAAGAMWSPLAIGLLLALGIVSGLIDRRLVTGRWPLLHPKSAAPSAHTTAPDPTDAPATPESD